MSTCLTNFTSISVQNATIYYRTVKGNPRGTGGMTSNPTMHFDLNNDIS